MSLAISRLMDALEWKPVTYGTPPSLVSDALPHVTHEGLLDFGGAKLRVYQLSTGDRVIDGEDLKEFFGV